jgi:D-3-phosphoglycerate dehydrogenase
MASGQRVSVAGTLAGPRHVEKLVEVDGFDMDLVPTEHMAFFRYDDRPGIVGIVGRLLGEQDINIGGMQVSRDARGGHAMVALTVDTAIPPATLDAIIAEIGAASGRAVDLVER